MNFRVRVPPSIELCRKNGLDVSKWIKEGWIDTVVAAPAYSMEFDLPLGGFKREMADHPVKVLAGFEKYVADGGKRYLTKGERRPMAGPLNVPLDIVETGREYHKNKGLRLRGRGFACSQCPTGHLLLKEKGSSCLALSYSHSS